MAVTADDIATSLGRPLTTAEQAQATQWIADAYMLIEVKFGTTYPDLNPDLVDYVVRESVANRFRHGAGDGTSSVTTTVDDGSVTRRWDSQDGGDSWLLDGWVDLLAPDRDSAAFSTRPSFEPDTVQWTPPPPRCDPEWWPLP
ncbi:hypothetical protein [Nocardioides sp. BYT-33-1]|uniref:hypothetical protein n=1 Tax=Nocardioides sp. BYT-33-1 TaxID=3416952 RepID=UPI003F53A635